MPANQPVEYEQVSYNVSTGIQICNTSGGKVGFFGTAPVAKQTVTGSVSSTAALTSLLSALATMGVITNSSSS